MTHLFIINPAAGGKKNRIPALTEKIKAEAEKRGVSYEIYTTKCPMDAVEEIRRRAADGAEYRVYACGGDGTFNECVNGAAGLPNVCVTNYPCGTGNDFIKMFGEEASLFNDLGNLIEGSVTPIDLIDCGERVGVNICSVGIDARIGTDVHKYSSIPIIGGATGYVVSLAVNIMRGINQKLVISSPEETLSGEFALVCACNGRYYGGGFNPVPDAVPNDGLMDILAVNAVSVFGFLSMVGKYAKGKYNELGDLAKLIRTDALHISSEKELVINVDGEAIYGKEIDFRVIRNGVRLIYPKNMKFFDAIEAKQEKNHEKL